MKEYRLISLDRFDGVNLESTVYMLSHNHSGKNFLNAPHTGTQPKYHLCILVKLLIQIGALKSLTL